MFQFLTLDHFNLSKKILGVRVDINSPIIDGKVVLNERIKAAAITIRELSDKGAKQVVMGHQGRKGKPDFISFKHHIKLLEKEVGKKIKFCEEIYSKKTIKEIEELKDGEILLLENLRFIADETNLNKKDNKILKLEKYLDYYIFDAFSLAHREQTSVVGFKKIPNLAGRQMEHELLNLNQIENSPNPHIQIFGGAKADDLIPLIEKGLKNKSVSLVLLTGMIGEIALIAKGNNLGAKEKFLKEQGYLSILPKLKELIKKYPHHLIFPKDVALLNNKKRVEIKIEDLEKKKKLLEKNIVQDIGSNTINYYSKLLKQAGSIYLKGPAGNFEVKGLEIGTKELMLSISNSKAFTFMGGGHSVTAASMFKVKNKFSYISLAGGALVKFLSREKLAGIISLEKSYKKYSREISDFTVVGSNVLDTYINMPNSFSDVIMGDKIKIEQNFSESIGGGGINTSISISRLGGMVSYLGKISQESQEKLLNKLNRNSISIIDSKISKRPVAKSVIIDTKDNDRVIMSYRGQNSYLEMNDFEFKDIKSNYVYFSALSKISFQTQYNLARKIKKENMKAIICYNPSAYLTKSEKNLKQILNYIDIVVLNYEEAQLLTQKSSINDCLLILKEKISKVVVITDGKNGSYAYAENKHYFQKSIKAKTVADTTGAGDCFASTFFYFYSKGYGISKALKYAAINSSSVVSKKGAIDGLLYYDDVVKK